MLYTLTWNNYSTIHVWGVRSLSPDDFQGAAPQLIRVPCRFLGNSGKISFDQLPHWVRLNQTFLIVPDTHIYIYIYRYRYNVGRLPNMDWLTETVQLFWRFLYQVFSPKEGSNKMSPDSSNPIPRSLRIIYIYIIHIHHMYIYNIHCIYIYTYCIYIHILYIYTLYIYSVYIYTVFIYCI